MSSTEPTTTQPVAQPQKPPQTIGGGFIVLRREAKMQRLQLRGGRPYEHADLQAAETEAEALAARFGDDFTVFQQVATVKPPAAAVPAPVEPPATGRRPILSLPAKARRS